MDSKKPVNKIRLAR